MCAYMYVFVCVVGCVCVCGVWMGVSTGSENGSLMPSLRTPHGKKQSGEQSQISWAYSQKQECKISNCYVALPLQKFFLSLLMYL